MFRKLGLLFTIPDLRKKTLVVLALLVVFRVATAIPVPGVDPVRLKEFISGSQFFGLLNIFSGGVLSNLSIAMLGVSPYITASIIMQLFTMIIPRMKEMYQEEGEAGRERFNQYARLLTVPLALAQGYALLTLLIRQQILPPLDLFGYASNLIVVTAGTIFLMWLGELITERGIGNGVSLMILAGIVASIPQSFQQEAFAFTTERLPSYIGFIAVALAVIVGVIIISEGERAIPVSYAKRIRGNRVFGGTSTHLPLRVNQAGVIPIIFAVSIILFPGLVGSFLAGAGNMYLREAGEFLVRMFENQLLYGAVYFFMVFVFTYFYTAVTFDPDSLAGALFLGVIAILPLIVQSIFPISAFTIGGTALLIGVSVIIETMKQIDAQLVMREYDKM